MTTRDLSRVDASAPFEPLWDASRTAQQLSMSVSWVYKRAERGELPCVRIGAALRFQPEAIRRYVERLGRGANDLAPEVQCASRKVDGTGGRL